MTIRLNVHETLPPHFNNFFIQDGRATFEVPTEFQIDLSIADESLSSQLYFIDFRLLFSPSGEGPTDRLRAELEGRVNEELKIRGLAGCYDFLHDLVMTNKILTWRKQALEMLRNQWPDSLRIDLLRRTLVVQYWLNRPGPKSWIQIGINSGRRNVAKLSGWRSGPPFLGIKWFREKEEIENPGLNLDLQNLSFEAITRSAIGLHSQHLLALIRDKLMEGELYAHRTYTYKLVTSKKNPARCRLEIQLTKTRSVTITIEPVSGRFVLSPASPIFGRAENDINNSRNPTATAISRISLLRTQTAQEEIVSRAKIVGWEHMTMFQPDQEHVRAVLPKDAAKLYLRRKGWKGSWIIACTNSMSADQWWAVETGSRLPSNNSQGQQTNSVEQMLLSNNDRVPLIGAHEIPMEPMGASSKWDFGFFLRLEAAAAGIISTFENTRALSRGKQRHLTRSIVVPSKAEKSSILVEFQQTQLPPLLRRSVTGRNRPPWAQELIRLTFNGTDPNTYLAHVTAEARLKTPFDDVQHLTHFHDPMISLDTKKGTFTMHFHTRVGEPCINHLTERLQRLERLVTFLSLLKKFDLHATTVSLTRTTFIYSKRPKLIATVQFPTDEAISISFSKNSPHNRIQDYLTAILNTRLGIQHAIFLLGLSQPLLLALDRLERPAAPSASAISDDTTLKTRPTVLARSSRWYTVRYHHPIPCRFEVTLRQRGDTAGWLLIEHSTAEEKAQWSSDVKSKLRQYFDFGAKDAGWMGLGSGGFALAASVGTMVEGLDELVGTLSIDENKAAAEAEAPAEEKGQVMNGNVKADEPAKGKKDVKKTPQKQSKAKGAKDGGGGKPDATKATTSGVAGGAGGKNVPDGREVVMID